MTDADERLESVRRLIAMNSTLRVLRENLIEGGDLAKAVDDLALAFAAYHLADSIAVYAKQLTRFISEEIENG